jgi:hypothetical protein
MRLFDLESGNTIDNVLFEIMLEGRNEAPMREQYVEALHILRQGLNYPIFRCLDRVLSEEEYREGQDRLFFALQLELENNS